MNIKFSASELLFYMALFFFITGNFFKQTVFIDKIAILSPVLTVSVLLSIVVLGIKLVLDYRYQTHLLILSIIFGAIFIVIALITKNMLLPITLFFFMVSVNNVPFKRIVFVCMMLLMTYMLIVHAAYLIGFLEGNDDIRIDGKIRYAIGYNFVTFASNFVFHILVMYLFIREEAVTWLELMLWTAIVYGVYRYTDTKSAFLFSLITVFVMVIAKLLVKRGWQFKRLSQIIIKYSVLISALLAFVMTISYSSNNAILVKLNTLLTERLRLGKFALEFFNIRFFGSPTEWIFLGDPGQWINGVWVDYLYADSSFINMLINYGVFMLLFVIVGFYLLGRKQLFQSPYFAISILIIAVHSMFDPQFLELLYNPFILSLGYLFSPLQSKMTKTSEIVRA